MCLPPQMRAYPESRFPARFGVRPYNARRHTPFGLAVVHTNRK
ncbi:hypothetical protein HMPREF0321_0017 [Dermacoccus sp. Ellin185]|nr:hypothetical protein HMPREF0321_0017 [Dermacoccus sp. Ellin185]